MSLLAYFTGPHTLDVKKHSVGKNMKPNGSLADFVAWIKILVLLCLSFSQYVLGSETEILSDDVEASSMEHGVQSESSGDESTQTPMPLETSTILELTTEPDQATVEETNQPDPEQPTPDAHEDTTESPPAEQKPISILGTQIPPGMATRVAWRPGHTLKGLASQAPVLVVHGLKPGPTLCITAAVHGDELNGIEIVRQVIHDIDAQSLAGTVIGVPIVNIQGFLRNSRYLVDRRDLNRYFPGNAHGSLAARIAHSFFNQVILNCSALVDIHTGSFFRDNLPQLRADLRVPSVVKLTEGFGSTVVLHSNGGIGTLRKSAVNAHIPAVTLELGGPMILDKQAVNYGVEGILNLLNALNMVEQTKFWGTPKPIYQESRWVRAEHGGIFFSKVKLGDQISAGDLLGTITNPITNEQFLLKSPHEGEVIGLAHNQVVYPGFAVCHLAITPANDFNDKGLESLPIERAQQASEEHNNE